MWLLLSALAVLKSRWSVAVVVGWWVFHGAGFAQKYPSTMLWEVYRPGQTKPSWLYGSMHSQDREACRIPDSAIAALVKADVFALETHPDSGFNAVTRLLLDQSNTGQTDPSFTWVDELPPVEYIKLDRKLQAQHNISLGILKTKPAFIAEMLLSNGVPVHSRQDESTFLDAQLYQYARLHGKPTRGLETLADYARVYRSFPEEKLRQALQDSDNPVTQQKLRQAQNHYNNLLKTYIRQDLNGIVGIIEKWWETEPDEKRKILERNDVMLRAFNRLSEQGQRSVFAVVGAAHLPGPSGLLDLLTRTGWRVRPIFGKEKRSWREYPVPQHLVDWQAFAVPASPFRLEVPFAPHARSIPNVESRLWTVVDIGTGVQYSFYALKTPVRNQVSRRQEALKLLASMVSTHPREAKPIRRADAEAFVLLNKSNPGLIRGGQVMILPDYVLIQLVSLKGRDQYWFGPEAERFWSSVRIDHQQLAVAANTSLTRPQLAMFASTPVERVYDLNTEALTYIVYEQTTTDTTDTVAYKAAAIFPDARHWVLRDSALASHTLRHWVRHYGGRALEYTVLNPDSMAFRFRLSRQRQAQGYCTPYGCGYLVSAAVAPLSEGTPPAAPPLARPYAAKPANTWVKRETKQIRIEQHWPAEPEFALFDGFNLKLTIPVGTVCYYQLDSLSGIQYRLGVYPLRMDNKRYTPAELQALARASVSFPGDSIILETPYSTAGRNTLKHGLVVRNSISKLSRKLVFEILPGYLVVWGAQFAAPWASSEELSIFFSSAEAVRQPFYASQEVNAEQYIRKMTDPDSAVSRKAVQEWLKGAGSQFEAPDVNRAVQQFLTSRFLEARDFSRLSVEKWVELLMPSFGVTTAADLTWVLRVRRKLVDRRLAGESIVEVCLWKSALPEALDSLALILQEGESSRRVVVITQKLLSQLNQALSPDELFRAFAGLQARGVSVVNLSRLLPMTDASMVPHIQSVAREIGRLTTAQLTPAALNWLAYLPRTGIIGLDLLDSLARVGCPMVALQSVKVQLENSRPLNPAVIRRLQHINETLYLVYALLKQHGQANAYFTAGDLDRQRLLQSQFTAWLMGHEGTYALTVEYLGTVPNTEAKDEVFCFFRYRTNASGTHWHTGCSGPHPENGLASEPRVQNTVPLNPEGKSIREIRKWFGV
jgi:uncharacterized protein YbaP (TraB family)